jgi:hypothetical protein
VATDRRDRASETSPESRTRSGDDDDPPVEAERRERI